MADFYAAHAQLIALGEKKSIITGDVWRFLLLQAQTAAPLLNGLGNYYRVTFIRRFDGTFGPATPEDYAAIEDWEERFKNEP